MTATPTFINIEDVPLEVLHIPQPAQAPSLAPLIFLHEGLGSVAMWSQHGRCWPQELCAASGRAGLLYSRRGYGQSAAIPDVRGPSMGTGLWRQGRHLADYMHHEAFEVLPRLLDACGIERPVLVGHSDGATVALLHASRFPVSACIAMAPHVMIEDMSLQAIEQAREAYSSTNLRDRLARYHNDVDTAFWQWNDVWLSEAFRSFDIRSECAHIHAPLMLVQGVNDEYGTLKQLDAILHAAPHGHRLELANCGHSPHRDQPELLTRELSAFLRSVD